MRRAALLAVAVLAPRCVAFAFTENFAGDAVSRTWLSYLWAQSPHIIASFDEGGFQFGSLHLYLLGPLTLWLPLEDAGRWLSLALGGLTALPLYALTKRLFGDRHAMLATLCFAAWGLHIQCSTTAAAEALNLLLVLFALALLARWFDTAERASLLGAALIINLACAARYDSWLLIPMLGGLIAWRSRSWRAALAFTVLSSAFALAWCWGNFVSRGAPLYPFTYIDAFHRTWFQSERAFWGTTRYRLITLLFWPGTALITLTPMVGGAAMLGAVKSWSARRDVRWLVVLILVPTVLYTVRSTLLDSFVPLTRFAIKEVALLLPFVGTGFDFVTQRLRPVAANRFVVASVLGAAAFSLWLGIFTYRTTGAWQDSLRAISPVTTNSLPVMHVARWLKEHASSDDTVLVVDEPPHGYDDMQVAFFSGFRFERLARSRSPLFEKRLAEGRARWLVRFEGGAFERTHQLDLAALTFRGAPLVEVLPADGAIHVYRWAE